MKIKITHIDYDANDTEIFSLPKTLEVDVPNATEDVPEYILNHISNTTGMCVNGFSWDKI
jgi:hypothetical protein